MKRPAFQFYPADWRNNAKLRRCSPAARGAWMDILCLLHDADEYGVLRWPLADIAQAAGIAMKLARELADKEVLKGADKGATQYVFTPRHAGKNGAPVTLVEAKDGPCWYCSRFVRDEYVRQQRGGETRFTGTPKDSPKAAPKAPIGDGFGDGSTSSSSSTSTKEQKQKQGRVAAPELPKWLPADVWADWHAFRNARKGWTAKARELSLRTLTELHDQGHDPRRVVDQSIERGWTGLFPIKPDTQPRGSPSVAQQFAGKTYEGTPDDELPDYLRPH